MPELDRGAPPLYKIGSQNTPYKLGLKYVNTLLIITCSPDDVGLPFILLN